MKENESFHMITQEILENSFLELNRPDLIERVQRKLVREQRKTAIIKKIVLYSLILTSLQLVSIFLILLLSKPYKHRLTVWLAGPSGRFTFHLYAIWDWVIENQCFIFPLVFFFLLKKLIDLRSAFWGESVHS